LSRSVLRKIMPVTPEGLNSLELFEKWM
jgi:hypothetical protein